MLNLQPARLLIYCRMPHLRHHCYGNYRKYGCKSSETTQTVSVPGSDLETALTAVSGKPIQLVVVAYQRAYMKVIVDGKETFAGRVIPGNVYTYSERPKFHY
jgi:hypothetical protein